MLNLKIINSNFPILITGETGTGKTTLAKKIHNNSIRRSEKFKSINVAALSDELFQSVMFGHKKGSFTGADREHMGLCEIIGGGTLLLDEIGDLSLPNQLKLLHLCDEGFYYPIGSNEKKIFKGRLIFATHRCLEEQVRMKLFREDLLYRINYINLKLGSLRDIGNERFIEEYFISNDLKLSSSILAILNTYHWPGNYRELENMKNYFLLLDAVRMKDLPERVKTNHSQVQDFNSAVASFEQKVIERELGKNKGKVNKTARELKMNKGTLISKIKKYDIHKDEYKIAN